MKVLFTSASLLADYGGPAFSITRLATSLACAGVEVGIWAADQSAAITPLLQSVSPVRRIIGGERDALKLLRPGGILHDSGIWLSHNHQLAILAKRKGIPRVISTRGMLEPWAFVHKRFKKCFAWGLYQRADLKSAQCHHATAETEARNLERFHFGVPIITIPNGVDIPVESPSGLPWHKPRTALFLGRICPVKGLLMLVKAWARVRPINWCLRIAGPDEAGHRKEVENAVLAAGLKETVFFMGQVSPQMKESVFFDADLFILPSHSESFGMAIAEALAHGLPVLTTTGTPWSSLREKGCGWWVEATTDGLEDGVRQATILEREALRSMGAKGREFVKAEFSWKRAAHRLLKTYELISSESVN